MNPEILCQPVIPPPLHGIAPRVVLGVAWWNRERKLAFQAAGNRCEACETTRADCWPSQWLEGHEEYEFLPGGLLVFRRVVSLCPACHKFIHAGLRRIQVMQGVLSPVMNAKIQQHGAKIIAKHERKGRCVMAKVHKIGWLNVPGYVPQTWNPIVGCSKVSPGCANCYAERMARRLALIKSTCASYGSCLKKEVRSDGVEMFNRYEGWSGKTIKVNSELEKPLHWKQPRAIFVNSMGDLFHENTPDWMIDEVFGVMLGCQVFDNFNHLFIVLTKRAERMAKYFSEDPVELMMRWARSGTWIVTKDEEENLHSWLSYDPRGYAKELMPLPNVWLGVTAENQEMADQRIPHLLSTPAAVRFVSVEPMVGAVDLFKSGLRPAWKPAVGNPPVHPLGTNIDWVICGGESGPGSRPMNPEWARSLRDQCQEADVPFFFKQWGDAKLSHREHQSAYAAGYSRDEKHGGDHLDDQQWHEWPNAQGHSERAE